MKTRAIGRERRKARARKKISGTTERPRMSVFRSLNNVSVQIIDDTTGKTLVQASTCEKGFQGAGHKGNRAAAKKVGVKELADAARQKGLKF